MLKNWRSQERLSQSEAADRLRVSVRTLQGWELGRPMPYPQLLQTAISDHNMRDRDMQSLLWPTFAPPHLGRLGGLKGRGMTTSKKWYDPKFEAARAYMDLMETVAGRHAVRFLEPNMLDGITKIAAVKSTNEPHGEHVHLTATLERLLGDTQLLISEDLQHSLRNAYERAESSRVPRSRCL